MNHKFLQKYGSWAIITGASDGVGREMAIYLAQLGLNLVLVARRKSVLEEISNNLIEEYKIETRVISADLSNHHEVMQVLSSTEDLDIGLFIASAGFGTSGDLINIDLKTELAMLDVNCRTVLTMSHYYGSRFAKMGRGGIILMSSLLAFQGVARAANYAATKAYIQTLAEGLHQELAPMGVDVIASAPGPIHSGFADRANMKMSMALQPNTVAEQTIKALGHKTTIRPGWLSKFLIGSLSLLPRSGRVRALGQVMKGMTAHQA